mgnify:CR=1 FL=1
MARPARPPSPVNTVRSVLVHERRLGYSDRATIGGLTSFWQHWLPKLEAAHPGEESRALLRRVTELLSAYGGADSPGRERSVSVCLALLDQLEQPGAGRKVLTDAGGEPHALGRGAKRQTRRADGGESTAAGRSDTSAAVRGIPGGRGPASAASRVPAEQAGDAQDRPAPARAQASTRAASAPGPPLGPRSERWEGADAAAEERGPARPRARQVQPGDGSRATRRPTDDLDATVSVLPGVGPANAQRLGRLGVKTVRDLLFYFPSRHIDYRDLKSIGDLRADGGDVYQTVLGVVADVRVERLRQRTELGGQWLFRDVPERQGSRPGLIRITARLRDDTGSVDAVWLRAQDYLSRELTPGRRILVSGQCRYKWRGETLEFVDPEYEFPVGPEAIHTARMVPVYRLTQGLGERWLRKLVKMAVDTYAPQLVDHLPPQVRRAANLWGLSDAIAQIHFPDSPESLERARRRLAFDELFLIQLGVLDRRRRWQAGPPGHVMAGGSEALNRFVESLPYPLTGAQRRVLGEIVADMSSSRPMSRLLQGEVGSGKTVVAAAAALVAVASGFQVAIMAPTEILAEQHYRTLQTLLGREELLGKPEGGSRSVRLGLLIGSLSRVEKSRAYQDIARGDVDVVVGTHALIQEGVEFDRLGLVVVDEQHRFGVLQRTALREKGYSPHLLVMTATPIPRTLALTVYGDLDVSVIDELPPGRQAIRTKCFGPGERQGVYEGLRREVQAGRQAYIICPLVEESDKLEVKAATAEYERLRRQVFPDLRLGLLHGRMKPAEKEQVMRAFERGELQVLVATAVVEVGIDVPNATCMVVEGADRFGLAQLHQFRGRVGRGSERSYCALLSESDSESARLRLEIVAGTADGFRLAEEDLRLRGPGEFFGTRQSGLPDLRLARPGDGLLLEQARTLAAELFRRDEGLQAPEHRLLAELVGRLWRSGELN